MKREQICYIPSWKGSSVQNSLEAWTKSYIKNKLWRLPRGYEFDDLIQDGYEKFLKCYKRYPEVTSPRHFMALYKRAFINHLNDLSNYASNYTDNHSYTNEDGESEDLIETVVGEYSNHGEIRNLIQNCPDHVRQVLEVLTIPVDKSPLVAPKKYRLGTEKVPICEGGFYNRETTNERVCRVLGWDYTQVDAIHLAKSYIKRRNTYTLKPKGDKNGTSGSSSC